MQLTAGRILCDVTGQQRAVRPVRLEDLWWVVADPRTGEVLSGGFATAQQAWAEARWQNEEATRRAEREQVAEAASQAVVAARYVDGEVVISVEDFLHFCRERLGGV